MPPAEAGADAHLYLGLISGTSVDGIDAALLRFEADKPCLVAAQTRSFEPALRDDILSLSQTREPVDPDQIAALDHRVGAAFADVVLHFLADHALHAEQITAIGSHGQTLRHSPSGNTPFTWQIGDPNLIVERTGITTVADFRRRDVAAGGQGAPLLPAFHHAMLGSQAEDVAILNLGGIANLTLLPREGEVYGFDTGPANGLMDAWILHHQGRAFDAGGRFAASGTVHSPLLDALLSDPFFSLPPPKSTGRDVFHLDWLHTHPAVASLPPADVQATLLELTARSVSHTLLQAMPDTRRLLVCGGGVHNPLLMQRLQALLPACQVESTASIGIDPDFVEAMGFAWLAHRTLARLPGNLPTVTGARGPRVLGGIYPA